MLRIWVLRQLMLSTLRVATLDPSNSPTILYECIHCMVLMYVPLGTMNMFLVLSCSCRHVPLSEFLSGASFSWPGLHINFATTSCAWLMPLEEWPRNSTAREFTLISSLPKDYWLCGDALCDIDQVNFRCADDTLVAGVSVPLSSLSRSIQQTNHSQFFPFLIFQGEIYINLITIEKVSSGFSVLI